MVRSCGGRRKLRGSGFMSFINKVGDFFKKSKIISRAAPMLGTLTGRPGLGSAVGGIAGSLGYGRRRRRRAPKRVALGGRRHFMIAPMMGISQPNRRISRLNRAF